MKDSPHRGSIKKQQTKQCNEDEPIEHGIRRLLRPEPAGVGAEYPPREQLEGTLELMATNLEGLTPGDRVALATTSFDLRKIPEHNTDPTATPLNLRIKHTGIPGEVKLVCDGVPQVLTYEYQWSQDPMAGPWTTARIVPTIRDMLVQGLARGKDTWFRVRAYGTNGSGPWSDQATLMVI